MNPSFEQRWIPNDFLILRQIFNVYSEDKDYKNNKKSLCYPPFAITWN